MTDERGLPVRLAITPGQAHDITAARELLDVVEEGQIVLGEGGGDDDDSAPAEEHVAETNVGTSLGLSFQVNQEVVQQFIGEAEDLLGEVETALLAMDEDAISDDELASGYRDRGMSAYSELQEREFADEGAGYTATRHQREVGTGYFDAVSNAVSGGKSSTTALAGSTEAEQFYGDEGQKAAG